MKTKAFTSLLAWLAGLATIMAVHPAQAATITWTNTNGGLWSAGTNWGSGTVPTASDDVLITAPGTYTVTQNVHVTIAKLTLGGDNGKQTLTNAGFNLALNGASTVNANGVLGLGGGTLGGTGLLGVSGTAVWADGTISGALEIASNVVFNVIGGSAIKHLSYTGTLINYGLIVWSGTNDIQTDNSARIINQPGALFDIQNNQSLAIYNGGAITNFGTIRKSAGGGTTIITVPLCNYGKLDVQSGTIGYGANSGNQFNDGTAFTGAGTNLVYAGTVSFNGAISSENLELGGATIGGNGNFSGVVNWTSGDLRDGTVTMASNGLLNIKGVGMKNLWTTGTLINHGSIVWSETNDIQTFNSARIINQPGALFDIQNNQSLAIWNGGAITNLGTIRKSAGGGTTTIAVPLCNYGKLDVQSGTIGYGANSGNQFNDGTAFTGAGTNLVYAGTVSFNGAILSENLELGGATIGGNGNFSGVVNWSSGDLHDGTVTMATNGLLNIKGVGTKKLWGTGTLINHGSIVWSETNDIQTFNSARIINQPGALFDIQNNQSLAIWNGGVITNLGTIRKSAGDANTLIGVPLSNSGTVDVQSGTITLQNYTQTGGKLSFGLNSLTNFGRIAFPSKVALTGTLAVNLNGGYVPVAGDAFALISYPSRTGAFADFDLPPSHTWQTNSSLYGPNAVTLTVLNARPTLNPILSQTANEETPITFTATASDPDPGQTCTFNIVGAPPGATIDPNTGAFSWTPTEAQGPSTNVIQVQVTDNGAPSLSAAQSVTIIVNEVNLSPTLTVPPTQTFDELTTLTVTNLATDPDLPANTLRFSLVNAPPGVNLNANTGVLTWTPTEAQGPSTNIITVAVTDNNPWAVNAQQLSVTNSFTVIVLESNSPPVLASIPDLIAVQDVPLLYTNSATDADLPANSLRFELVEFPSGMHLNATNGVLSWTPNATQVPTTNRVTVRVTDNGEPAKSDSKSFSVVAYPLPSLTIVKAGTNVVLSWPSYAATFTLQQAAGLEPPISWTGTTNAVTSVGGWIYVTNGVDASEHFYRIASP